MHTNKICPLCDSRVEENVEISILKSSKSGMFYVYGTGLRIEPYSPYLLSLNVHKEYFDGDKVKILKNGVTVVVAVDTPYILKRTNAILYKIINSEKCEMLHHLFNEVYKQNQIINDNRSKPWYKRLFLTTEVDYSVTVTGLERKL